MNRERTIGCIGIAALAAVLTGAAQWRAGRQDAPAAPTIDERVHKLEQLATAQQTELDRLARIAAALTTGAAKLAGAVDQAEVKGFAAAGPNPAARTELLEGLRAFNATVKAAAEPPKSPEKK